MADKLVIMLLTIDPDKPEYCGTPFFQAAAAAAMGAEVEIYFASRAVRLLIQGIADRIYPSDSRVKTVYSFMQEASQLGVKFYACAGAMETYSITSENMVPEVTGVGGATAYMSRVLNDEWKTISY